MPKINPLLLLLGGGAAVYLLSQKNSTPGQTATSLTALLPGAAPAQIVGINSGIKGGNGSYYTVSNYAQCLAAYPNLGNPNYQLTPAEQAQYIANYSDLQQWVASPDSSPYGKQLQPNKAQYHWQVLGGCAQQRIFIPLTPPSTANYVPVPKNNNASDSSSWVGTALQVAGTVAALLGPNDQLNDTEINIIVTGAAILKKILPFYLESQSILVNSIENKLDTVLSQYQN